MLGMRPRSGRASARLLALSSVLALLALACFPLAAFGDSGSAQYEEALPEVCGSSCKQKESPAKTSKSNTGGGGTSTSHPSNGSNGTESSSGGSDEESATGGVAANGGGNGAGGGSGGAEVQQHQDQGKAGGSPEPAQPLGSATNAKSDDDGSSPLVPILIAIAVLAAISVAAFVIRQRRHRADGGTPSVSPKAG